MLMQPTDWPRTAPATRLPPAIFKTRHMCITLVNKHCGPTRFFVPVGWQENPEGAKRRDLNGEGSGMAGWCWEQCNSVWTLVVTVSSLCLSFNVDYPPWLCKSSSKNVSLSLSALFLCNGIVAAFFFHSGAKKEQLIILIKSFTMVYLFKTRGLILFCGFVLSINLIFN